MKTENTPIRPLVAAFLLSVALAFCPTEQARAAEDEAVAMIVELITGSDKDMQTMAIQQIRQQSPGKEATLRFAGLLAKLQPETQAKLVDALGARGDVVARPAIIKMLNSKNEAVRIAAAGALSALASPDDIPALAKQAAAGADQEKKIARKTLRQLRGEKMDAAMIGALKDADAKTRIELINALTDRNTKTAASVIVKLADDSDPGVRLAVLAALRAMGDENHTAVLVKRLKSAKDKSEQRRAALALLSVCRRGKAKCSQAVIDGFDGADPPCRILLMRVLVEAGGPKSLAEIVARLSDSDKTVSSSALRVLVAWPDRDAIEHLKKLAADVKNPTTHILAIRGIIRLARPGKDRPADLALLSEAMKLASRNEEKILALSTAGSIGTLESLTLVASALDTPALTETACSSAVLIAETIAKGDKAQVRTVMQKVIKTVKNEKTLNRAKKVIEGL
jgi:HEAT repeat protein